MIVSFIMLVGLLFVCKVWMFMSGCFILVCLLSCCFLVCVLVIWFCCWCWWC